MRNGQAYQRKTEKFFVYEEKKFGRIDSRLICAKSVNVLLTQEGFDGEEPEALSKRSGERRESVGRKE